jgi:hypothetical protein
MPERPQLASRVAIGKDVVFRELDGEAVLLNLKTGVYFGLDAVGTRIWQLLGEHGELARVARAVQEEYDVAAARSEADLLRLVAQLREKGLIEVVGEPPAK